MSIDLDQITPASCQRTPGLLCKNKPKKVKIWINDREASEADLQKLPEEARQLISLISNELKQGYIVVATGENTRDNFAQVLIRSYSKKGALFFPRMGRFAAVHKTEIVQSLIKERGLRVASQDAYVFLKKEWAEILKVLEPRLLAPHKFEHFGNVAKIKIVLPEKDEEHAKRYLEDAFKRVFGKDWNNYFSYHVNCYGKSGQKQGFLFWVDLELKKKDLREIGYKIDHKKALKDFIKTIKKYPFIVSHIAKQLPTDSERGGMFYAPKSGYLPYSPQFYIAEPKILEAFKAWWDEILADNFSHLDNFIKELGPKKGKILSEALVLLKRLKKAGELGTGDWLKLKLLMAALLERRTFDESDLQKEIDIMEDFWKVSFWEIDFHSHPIPSRPSDLDRWLKPKGKSLVLARDEDYNLYGYYYSSVELHPLRRIFAYAESILPKQRFGGGYSTERGFFGRSGFQTKLPGLDMGLAVDFSGSRKDASFQGGLTYLTDNAWFYKFSLSKVFENEPKRINYISGNARLDVVTPFLDELELGIEYRKTRLDNDLSLSAKTSIFGIGHAGFGYRRGFNGNNLITFNMGLDIPADIFRILLFGLKIPGTISISIDGAFCPEEIIMMQEFSGNFSYIYKKSRLYYQLKIVPDESRHIAGLSIALADRHSIETNYISIERKIDGKVNVPKHHFGLSYIYEF